MEQMEIPFLPRRGCRTGTPDDIGQAEMTSFRDGEQMTEEEQGTGDLQAHDVTGLGDKRFMSGSVSQQSYSACGPASLTCPPENPCCSPINTSKFNTTTDTTTRMRGARYSNCGTHTVPRLLGWIHLFGDFR